MTGSTPLRRIRNIGVKMEAAFLAAGIDSAEALRDLGADAAYARLLASGHRPHILAFTAVALGLEGRHWNAAEGAEKAALRARYDAILAGQPRTLATADDAGGRSQGGRPADRPPPDLEAELDRLGLRGR